MKNLKCRAQIHTRVSLAIRLLVVRVKLKLSALKPNILKPVMAAMSGHVDGLFRRRRGFLDELIADEAWLEEYESERKTMKG